MGEYAEIYTENLALCRFKNYLKSDLVSLFFSEKDLIVTENYYLDTEDKDCEPITRYEYKTSVKKARERLDAMGYGIKHLENLFEINKYEAINYFPFLSKLNVDLEDEELRERIDKKVTFKKWTNSIKKIIEYELKNGSIDTFHNRKPEIITTECDKVIFYDRISDYVEYLYALDTEVIHEGYIYRLILEYCDEAEEIQLDFTNLGNWDSDCIPKGIEAAKQNEKTIVLVEGTSDKTILEFCLQRIYPHLFDLFYFMDFDDGHGHKRSNSGVSEISKCMETFYYSRIKNKFIALFDNDAAGYSSSLELMNKVKVWPDNFRIMCYPPIDEFKKYPTLAPNGKILEDDINHKACSIELYLPDSVISDDGEYLPIEWEARKQIKQDNRPSKYLYQGVISEKDTVKSRLIDLKRSIEAGKTEFKLEEWKRMQLLLENIVYAFAN